MNDYNKHVISMDDFLDDSSTEESDSSESELNPHEGTVIEHPHIPKGEYRLKYLSHVLQKVPKYGGKLIIEFVIVEGDYHGVILNTFYNVDITEKGFVVRGGTRYLREMRQLFPKHRQSYPVGLLKGKIIHAWVRDTNREDKKKKVLPYEDQYSVVGELIKIIN